MNKTYSKPPLKWPHPALQPSFISPVSDCSADLFLCFYFSTAKPLGETCQALSRGGFPSWSVRLVSCFHAGCQKKLVLSLWKWLAGRGPDFLSLHKCFHTDAWVIAARWAKCIRCSCDWLKTNFYHCISAARRPTRVKETPTTTWICRCSEYVFERIIPNHHLILQACPEGLSYHLRKRRRSALTASIKLLICQGESLGDGCWTGKRLNRRSSLRASTSTLFLSESIVLNTVSSCSWWLSSWFLRVRL